MGKILVIQGADFSTNKIDTVKIRPKDWIDYEIYISSVEEIENPEYNVVYLDSDDKILYGITVENEIVQPEYDNVEIRNLIDFCERYNRPQTEMLNVE